MISFVPSAVFNHCYHAMLRAKTVGMIILGADQRWHATAYRSLPQDDLVASFPEMKAAEQFVRANSVVVSEP